MQRRVVRENPNGPDTQLPMPAMHQGIHHKNNQKTQTATNFLVTTLRPPPTPYVCVVCQQPSPKEGNNTVKCRKCKNRSHKPCLQPKYPSITNAREYTCRPCARSFKEKLKADKLARGQIAGAQLQPIQHRPSTSKKATFPAGDWIPRLTLCTQCDKPNDYTSNHSCAQCSRKAHMACVTERKKCTKSQTFFCIT